MDTLHEHWGYLSDERRLDLYRQAVQALVRPGMRVLDLGCGVGVLGLLCLQAGAQSVIGIDHSDAADWAEKSMRLSPWQGRYQVLREDSSETELSELADLVICDHVGYFGFDYGLLGVLADARKRLLKPGGTVVPSRLRVCLAGVDSPQCSKLLEQWREPHIPAAYHWLNALVTQRKHGVDLLAQDVKTNAQQLADLDLTSDQPDYFSWTAQLLVTQDAHLSGLAGWFECELVPGVWMSNSPLAGEPIARHQAFLPFTTGLPVRQGERLCVGLAVRPQDNQMAWTVQSEAGQLLRSGDTWAGTWEADWQVPIRLPGHRPRLGRWSAVRAWVMQRCDGQHSVSDIVQAAQRQFPQLWRTPEQAKAYVLRVVRECVR